MKLFFFKVIIAIIIVGAGTYLSEWLGAGILSAWNKIWVVTIGAIITAVAVIFSDTLSDNLGRYLSKPSLLIKTSKSDKEINIIINIKGSIERISLDYPILGQITHFQDLNTLTDARTVLAQAVGGAGQGAVQNNLQFTITDIKSNIKLQYKIFYNMISDDIMIAGIDRYELIYTWKYNGENIQENEWRMTKGDALTTESPIKVVSTEISNKALTTEEIKKMYETGPTRRNF